MEQEFDDLPIHKNKYQKATALKPSTSKISKLPESSLINLYTNDHAGFKELISKLSKQGKYLYC